MKTAAVTAGHGAPYYKAAQQLTKRWNRLAGYIDDGFECINLSEMIPWEKIHNEIFCKTHIWDHLPTDINRVVWIDCDCFVTRPVHLHELPDAPWCAVEDVRYSQERMRENWPAGDKVEKFFNAGVFIATRETQPVFDEVRALDDANESKKFWDGDQRWFNLYVAKRYKDFDKNPTGWHELGIEWNALSDHAQPTRPILTHFAGAWNRWNILDMLYSAADEIERFAHLY